MSKELEIIDEENKNTSMYKGFWSLLLFVLVVFFVSDIIDKKNDEIDTLKTEKLEVQSELYKYKREVVISNLIMVSDFLKNKFPDMKEYRIMDIGNNTITVLVNEPIKKSDNKVGYSSENIYQLDASIQPGKLGIKSISEYLKNRDLYNTISDTINYADTNIITKTFTEIGFNTATFLAKYIIHIEPEQVSTFFNNLNNMFIELERDKIEKPILILRGF